uniref:M18 family aminopeptidase n=1 Tax=Corynebacterium durum TaxID=61592 RepID=UPI0028E87E57
MRSFLDFIASSPSSFHAAHQVARRLDQAGFAKQDEAEPWDASPGGHYVVRGGAIMAWWVPENASPESGFRIVGSHTDSPGFKVKPGTDFTTAGWQQVAVEVYGGPILTSWFDRELVLAGRVILSDGSEKMVATGPLLRIPNLAIHLSRDKAQDTSTLSRQVHLQPVMGVGDPEASVLDVVAASAGVDKHDIVAHDLITCDAQRGEMFGANMDLVAAGRLDNLSSVYASLEAFIAALQSGDAGNDVLVLAAFDHEEVGSATISGAAGPLLENVLVRTAQALKADTEDLHRMFARSW